MVWAVMWLGLLDGRPRRAVTRPVVPRFRWARCQGAGVLGCRGAVWRSELDSRGKAVWRQGVGIPYLPGPALTCRTGPDRAVP
jgi:hypothetical protein